MKTTTLETKIVKFLADGPRSITEIKDHLNRVTCHGTTMSQLVNVLGKRSVFEMVGMDKCRNYKVTVWALKQEA